jgi:hypothetical protein
MCSGGDLNPHALRHTPLKRTCLPFHHPSGGTELVSRTVLLASVSWSSSGRARLRPSRELTGCPGSGGASPYQALPRASPSLSPRLGRWNHRNLDPFSRPGVFENFRPILQCKFVGDDLVDFNFTALKIRQRTRERVYLRE